MTVTCNLVIINRAKKLRHALNPTEKSIRRTWHVVTCILEKGKKNPERVRNVLKHRPGSAGLSGSGLCVPSQQGWQPVASIVRSREQRPPATPVNLQTPGERLTSALEKCLPVRGTFARISPWVCVPGVVPGDGLCPRATRAAEQM